jgi:hypothetical protein
LSLLHYTSSLFVLLAYAPSSLYCMPTSCLHLAYSFGAPGFLVLALLVVFFLGKDDEEAAENVDEVDEQVHTVPAT